MPKRAASSGDELRDLIRARQLRATPARVAVLEVLRRSASPMTHVEVCARFAGPHDRATIYRALNQLAGARLLRRVDLGDRVWRFAIEDPARPFRADFVCSKCGAVLAVPGVAISASTPGAPRAVSRGQVEIRLLGRCDNCQ